jgi:hypothetical protein
VEILEPISSCITDRIYAEARDLSRFLGSSDVEIQFV